MSSTHLTAPRLAPCPESPNCVSTEAPDARHAVAPLRFEGDPDVAMDRLARAVTSLRRSRVVQREGFRLKVEVRSLLFRFVDDVDCVVDPVAREIHVRSASRTGTWDFGVNRRRVEAIRRLFATC